MTHARRHSSSVRLLEFRFHQNVQESDYVPGFGKGLIGQCRDIPNYPLHHSLYVVRHVFNSTG
jgi:hypothetical protein